MLRPRRRHTCTACWSMFDLLRSQTDPPSYRWRNGGVSTTSDFPRIAVINQILRNARSHLRDGTYGCPPLDPILGRSSAWPSTRRAREARPWGRRVSALTRCAARTRQVDPFVEGPLGLSVHDFGARARPRSPSSNSRPLQRPHRSNSCDHESARNSRQGFTAA